MKLYFVIDRILPATQSVQTDSPSDGVYLPLAHATQSSSLSLPVVGRYLPAVQSEHTPAPVAPVVVEYLPVAQSPAHMAAEVAPVAAE